MRHIKQRRNTSGTNGRISINGAFSRSVCADEIKQLHGFRPKLSDASSAYRGRKCAARERAWRCATMNPLAWEAAWGRWFRLNHGRPYGSPRFTFQTRGIVPEGADRWSSRKLRIAATPIARNASSFRSGYGTNSRHDTSPRKNLH